MEIKLHFPDQVADEDKDFARFFEALQQMLNRMAVSHFKYGRMADSADNGVVPILTARQRMTMYDGKNRVDSCDCGNPMDDDHSQSCFLERKNAKKNTGNTENLLDAANCLVIEHLFPTHKKAHFKSQESKDSPGLAYEG